MTNIATNLILDCIAVGDVCALQTAKSSNFGDPRSNGSEHKTSERVTVGHNLELGSENRIVQPTLEIDLSSIWYST
jgi:hypothetical protein